ncbi:G2/mitotic-specific cyclin [Marasmius crinis-equi]|uniref:G2/mitotic-specific cyclin n=1 Tax=Marasmius crinis-equi TaxID=585013 RepID=A0ABR3FB37_9AGAR
MSSNIPVRRTTRTVTKSIKETENANARPSRIATRTKTTLGSSSTSVLSDAVTTRSVAATTASSRAKAVDASTEKTVVGKRKREILAEVTEVNKGKGKTTAKGKEKAEGSSSKPEVRSRTVAKGTRPALRKATGPVTRSARRDRAHAIAVDSVAPGEDAVIEDAQSTLPSSDIPDYHLIPKDEEPTGTLPTIAEDDTDHPRVFKKRHTEPAEEPKKPIPELPPAGDASRYEEEYVATELAMVDDADGETGKWDDLDACDMDDPYMVAEYIHEIAEYLKEREQKTLPMESYMDNHRDLTWDHRQLVMDWIGAIHARYAFLPESYFLFVNIFDRFLSLRGSVTLKKLQLVAVSSFCIAVKYEEGVSPSLQELVKLTEDAYSADEICKAERYVLKTLSYDLSFPGPMTWLRRGSKADELEPRARTIAKYLLEAASFEHTLVAVPPSLQAAASLWFARLMLHREDWNANLIHYTTYKEREVVEVANRMLYYLLQYDQSENLYKKYASKKYFKCSVFVRKWALNLFKPGSEPDLAEMLPAIKADIREQREAKLAAEEYI